MDPNVGAWAILVSFFMMRKSKQFGRRLLEVEKAFRKLTRRGHPGHSGSLCMFAFMQSSLFSLRYTSVEWLFAPSIGMEFS